MRILIIIAVVLAGLAAPFLLLGKGQVFRDHPAPSPDAETREIAFVANAVGGSVTLIDIEAQTVIGELDVIPDGRRVGFRRDPVQALIGQSLIERQGLNYAQDTDLSPDGRVLYVSRGHLGDVVAFDIASGEMIWRRPIAGLRADHMDVAPDGSRLFVSAMTSNRLVMLDARDGHRIGAIETGTFPHDVHVTDDGERVYVAALGNMLQDVDERSRSSRPEGAYPVTIADAETGEVLRRIPAPMGQGLRPFAVTADETTIYAQQSNHHDIVRLDARDGSLAGHFGLPVPSNVSEADWDFEAPHHGLALSPDESRLCLAGRASDYAVVLPADDWLGGSLVWVGDAPSWSAITADGRLCLLANNRSDDVSIVDMDTLREIARLPAGRAPKHITIGDVPVEVLAGMGAD